MELQDLRYLGRFPSMKILVALIAVVVFGCSSSTQKKAADDAPTPATVETPAAEDAAPAAPAEDAGPAVALDAMPAATDDEHPPMPAPKK